MTSALTKTSISTKSRSGPHSHQPTTRSFSFFDHPDNKFSIPKSCRSFCSQSEMKLFLRCHLFFSWNAVCLCKLKWTEVKVYKGSGVPWLYQPRFFFILSKSSTWTFELLSFRHKVRRRSYASRNLIWSMALKLLTPVSETSFFSKTFPRRIWIFNGVHFFLYHWCGTVAIELFELIF